MIRQGEVDAVRVDSPSQAEQVIALPKSENITVTPIKYQGFVEVCYFGFDFDVNKAPAGNTVPGDFFDDIHMRKAFSYSVDYEKYVKDVYLGWAEPAKGALTKGWPGYYENFPYKYNLTAAAQEFKLAWNGKYWDQGFEVTYCYQAWAESTAGVLGRMIAESVAKVNPKFKVIPVVVTWSDLVGGGSPLGTMVSENGPDPYYITNVYSPTYGYAGEFGYKNPQVDELLIEAQATADPAKQVQLYIDAQKIIKNDVPGILTVYTPTFFASKTYVKGFQYSVAWLTDPGWIYLLSKR
jgi:peptide/nickel transport system substrate-binding protein